MLTGVASPTTVRIGGVTSELSATRRKNCSASHLRFTFHTACKSNQSCPSLKKGTPRLNKGVSDDQSLPPLSRRYWPGRGTDSSFLRTSAGGVAGCLWTHLNIHAQMEQQCISCILASQTIRKKLPFHTKPPPKGMMFLPTLHSSQS